VTATHVHGLMADLLAFRKRQAAPFEERAAAFVAGLRALTRQTGVAVDVQECDDPYISVGMFLRDTIETPGEYVDNGEISFVTDAARDAAIARAERAKRAAETRRKKRAERLAKETNQ